MPKEFISPSFIDRLCAPSCMQCCSPMTMALSPGLILATYECSVCGLRIARKSMPPHTSAKPANKQSAPPRPRGAGRGRVQLPRRRPDAVPPSGIPALIRRTLRRPLHATYEFEGIALDATLRGDAKTLFNARSTCSNG